MNKQELHEYFSKLGKKGGNKTKKLYPKEFFIENGRKGGEAKKKNLENEKKEKIPLA